MKYPYKKTYPPYCIYYDQFDYAVGTEGKKYLEKTGCIRKNVVNYIQHLSMWNAVLYVWRHELRVCISYYLCVEFKTTDVSEWSPQFCRLFGGVSELGPPPDCFVYKLAAWTPAIGCRASRRTRRFCRVENLLRRLSDRGRRYSLQPLKADRRTLLKRLEVFS